MKATKRVFCVFSFYDQLRIQEKLEDMAERGWMIQQPGNFTWQFKRMEPKKLRFSVTYFPKASEFDPGPTAGELTKMDFCARDGWQLAGRWGVMQIFYNENLEAVPIETDPVAQVENIRKAMGKNVVLPHALTAALIVYFMVTQFWWFDRDPVGFLSDPLRLYQIPMWISLLLACVYELGFYFWWTRKAKKAAAEGVFLPIQTGVKASWLLLGFSLLLMLFAFGSSRAYMLFGLVWCGVLGFIFFAVNAIKKRLKKKGVSREVNFAVSIGSVFVLTTLFLGALVAAVISSGISLTAGSKPVGAYEYKGMTWEIYDDPLPLEVEDLLEMDGNWSKEARRKQTGLLAYAEYEQRALFTEPREVPNLRYTITDVKAPFLHERVKQAVLDSRQDEVIDGFLFTDHYEPVDPSVWGADEAYQVHWSGTIMDTYLLFWDNRIVEIKFYWQPTAEQIAKAAEILRSAV